MLDRFWLKVEKRPTTEPTNIRKTLNVRQRHISTFLNAINNKTLDPQQAVSFSAPRAPSWRDPLGHNPPIISPDSKSKPTISRTRSFTLIPTGNTRRSENPRQADNTVVSKKQARIKFRQKTNPEKNTLPYRSHDARVVDKKLSEKKAMIAEVEVQLVFFAKRFFLVSVSRFFGSFLLRLLYRRRNRGSCLGWFQDLSRRL